MEAVRTNKGLAFSASLLFVGVLAVCLNLGCDSKNKTSAIEEVTGSKTRVVWWRNAGGDNHDLMSYDSGVGEERLLLENVPGRGPDYPPGLAFITHDGARIIFSVHDERLVKVIDWDGSDLRVVASGYLADILYDEARDVEWAYVLSVPRFDPVEPIIRYDIDNPKRKETVWTNTVTWEFRVSGDGKRAAISCPWPIVGMADLSDGETIQPYSSGCWADVSPDSQHRFIHFVDGNHRQIRAYDDNATNPRTIELGDVINREGEGLFMLWTNHPRLITVSAPWKDESCDIYLVRVDEGLTTIEEFAVLGEGNDKRDQGGSAWINPGGESDARIQAFSASSSTILAGDSTTLSWSTKNADFVSIEPGIGSVSENGECSVTPSETTTFVLSVVGTQGPRMRRLVVEVSHLRQADNVEVLEDGLLAEYYVLDSPDVLPDFSLLAPYSTGTVPLLFFEPTLGHFASSGRSYDVGAVFSGYIRVPADGLYTFYLKSDDGSRLYVGSDLVVDNDLLHPLIERSGLVGLKEGLHSFRVEYFDKGHEAGLIAEYEGPDLPRRTIPASSFYRKPMFPRMMINPKLLSFSRTLSGQNPPPQRLEITNIGDGILEPVSSNMTYEVGGNVGWLTIYNEGEGNSQSLVHEVKSDTVPQGKHSATISLSCENSIGPPSVYPVSLFVTDQPLALDRIAIEPSTTIIEAGASVELKAHGLDQFGSPLATRFEWRVDAGGTIHPDTSGEIVFEHEVKFLSDGSTGQYFIVVTSEGIDGSARVQVVDGRVPRISLFEPVAGDVWEAGSMRFVKWETKGVDGVRIYISTDNGKGWEPIVPVVDIHDEDWGNYPVVVPHMPSEQCLIQIEGYFSETAAVSGLFSIVDGS